MQEEANSFALELAVHKKCSQTQTCHMNFTFKIILSVIMNLLNFTISQMKTIKYYNRL